MARPGAGWLGGLAMLAGSAAAQAPDPALAPVGARIRAAGFACAAVVRISHDVTEWLPQAALWDNANVLATCADGARYLVILPARVQWGPGGQTPWHRAEIRPVPSGR